MLAAKGPEAKKDAPGSWGEIIDGLASSIDAELAKVNKQVEAMRPAYDAAVHRQDQLAELLRAVRNAYRYGRYVDGTDEQIPF